MSSIDITNLTFAYDGSYDNIFTNVSFRIDTDWKLGFCGRNGRGKTTFLRLLMGTNQSQAKNKLEYGGSIKTSVHFEYFPYNVSDLSQNTIDVLETTSLDAPLWKIQKELLRLAVAEEVLYRTFSTLSNGERTKVLLAALFLRENNFLLIDEPTNHLDMMGRETVAQYLKSKNGFILVSHDRAFLDECVDHMLSINRTNIEIQKGNFSSWWHNKQMQDDFELTENERLKKDIKRLEEAARQSSLWADKVESAKMGKGAAKTRKLGHHGMDTMAYYGEKSRRMQQRRKNLERRQNDRIEEKSKLLKNIEDAENLKLHPLKYHTNRMVSIENLSVSYGSNPVFSDFGITVLQGERIALMGSNGCGKSTLLKLICGEDIAHKGDVSIGSRIILSYVPQDPSFLTGGLSEYAEESGIDGTLFRTILRKLDFSRVQFEKDMQDYSAGQKKKVLLARSLCEQAHLYIWDEPLNYVDVLSRIQIEDLILEYKPTLIFVEHDRVFCGNIATKTVQLDLY